MRKDRIYSLPRGCSFKGQLKDARLAKTEKKHEATSGVLMLLAKLIAWNLDI